MCFYLYSTSTICHIYVICDVNIFFADKDTNNQKIVSLWMELV